MHNHYLYFQLYLKKFGYLEHTTGKKQLATMGREAVSAAIKDFQRFAGLRKTGECTIINI